MNKIRKFIALLTTLALMFSFVGITTLAEEIPDTPAATEETEIKAGAQEECEISTNASIILVVTDASLNLELNDEYEITIGQACEVLSVIGIFGGADANLGELNLDGLSVEASIAAIISSYGILSEYEMTVTTNNAELLSSLAVKLQALSADAVTVEYELEELECESNGNQPDFIVDRFVKATQLGITPGKMRLLEKFLMTLDEDAELDLEKDTDLLLIELAGMSVKEIMQRTKANKKATKFGEGPATEEALEVEVEAVVEVQEDANVEVEEEADVEVEEEADDDVAPIIHKKPVKKEKPVQSESKGKESKDKESKGKGENK